MGKGKKNRIGKVWQTLQGNERGSAIVMVLVAMAFVGIMASLLMYVSLVNYRVKITDRKAKDNFYSAEFAMDEIRAGLQDVVYHGFSKAYEETMQNYAADENVSKNTFFKERYVTYITDSLKMQTNSEKYDIAVLRKFVTKPAESKNELGVYIESSSCDFIKEEDEMRLMDIKVIYTDEAGYVSVIESDILLAVPNLGIHATYEFPKIEEYCVIAQKKIYIGNGTAADNGVIMKGSIYGGEEGIELDSQAAFYIQGYQAPGENTPKAAMAITDGEILLGNEMAYNSSKLYTGQEVSLWTSGIRVEGIASTSNGEADNYVVLLQGNTYVQDDLTIDAAGTGVYLSGSYTGFGNANTKAENSSSIIINGTDTVLNMGNLTSLSLGGNTYVGTSKLDISDMENQTFPKENKDIKMGNAVASKAEQIAYLVPIECIGYDLAMNRTIVGRNPVNVKDKLYQEFLELSAAYPEDYKEVNLNLIDETIGKPLTSYGATYEKVYYKPDRNTIWIYYYLKFASSFEASRFFRDYYTANPTALNHYIENYIRILEVGNLENLNLNMVGNMVVKDSLGNFRLIEATVGENLEEQIQLNKEYAQYGNQFVSLCKKLNPQYETLTAKEREEGVYNNIINTELIQQCKNLGIFLDKFIVFQNESAGTLALLILNDGDDGEINLYQAFEEAGIAKRDWGNIHLVISERDLEVKPYKEMTEVSFNGSIIVDGSLIVPDNKAVFSIIESMDDTLLGSYSYEYGDKERKLRVLSLFWEGKDSEIMEEIVGAEEENSITTEKLVVYENWTKK